MEKEIGLAVAVVKWSACFAFYCDDPGLKPTEGCNSYCV